MSDYTPTTDEVRHLYASHESGAEFDRWLKEHDAQVAAKALKDAVDEDGTRIPDVLGYRVAAVFVESLLDRADHIRSEAGVV